MRQTKPYIAIFYLILFISIKLIGLHEFTHSENEHIDDCKLCEYVITSQDIAYTVNETFTIEVPIQDNFKKQLFDTYAYHFTQTQINNALFSRPPPVG